MTPSSLGLGLEGSVYLTLVIGGGEIPRGGSLASIIYLHMIVLDDGGVFVSNN